MQFILTCFLLCLISLPAHAQLDTLVTLDSLGNRVKVQLSEDGKARNSILHYTYDEQKRVTKQYETDTLGEIQSHFTTGEIMTFEYEETDGFTVQTIRHFDENMEASYDLFHIHKHVVTTNAKEQIMGISSYLRTGKFIIRSKHYYELDLLTKTEYLDEYGELQQGKVAITTYVYDSLHRVIEERAYDHEMQPYSSASKSFLKQITYLYDIECERYFDVDNQEVFKDRLRTCDTIPLFGAYDKNGDYVNISALSGKIVVIYLWTTNTVYGSKVDADLAILQEIRNAYPDDRVEIFSVAIEKNPDDWREKLRGLNLDGWTYNLFDDRYNSSEVMQIITPNRLSMGYVINEEGVIVESKIRDISNIPEILEMIVDK